MINCNPGMIAYSAAPRQQQCEGTISLVKNCAGGVRSTMVKEVPIFLLQFDLIYEKKRKALLMVSIERSYLSMLMNTRRKVSKREAKWQK